MIFRKVLKTIYLSGRCKNIVTITLFALLLGGCVLGVASRDAYEDVYYDRCFESIGGDRPQYCDR